jgi:hypothetical protein
MSGSTGEPVTLGGTDVSSPVEGSGGTWDVSLSGSAGNPGTAWAALLSAESGGAALSLSSSPRLGTVGRERGIGRAPVAGERRGEGSRAGGGSGAVVRMPATIPSAKGAAKDSPTGPARGGSGVVAGSEEGNLWA